MDELKLESKLRELKHIDDEPMSPLVRTRLNETYAQLKHLPAGNPKKGMSRQWIRKAASITAAAAVLGITVFASGFVSPVMAKTIKQIPVIGSIFSTIEADLGLRGAGEQGLTSDVNRSIAYQDITLHVTQSVFDGTRAAFLVDVKAPNLKDGILDTGKDVVKLSSAIENVEMKVNGKGQADTGSLTEGGTFYYGAGKAHPNTLVFEQVLDANASHSSSGAPEALTAEISLKLQGIDHVFKIDVPLQKTTKDMIQLKPNQSQTSENMTFTVSEVDITPVTTRVTTTIQWDAKSEDKLSHVRVAVFDDQGRQLPALHGEGSLDDSHMTFDARYASLQGKTKYLILKPFIYRDDFAEEVRDDQFIKGLEVKVDISASPE